MTRGSGLSLSSYEGWALLELALGRRVVAAREQPRTAVVARRDDVRMVG